eukprot:gene1316-3_t
MATHIQHQQWFGNNSKFTKYRRLCCELQQHMRKDISADRRDLRLSYVPYLRNTLLEPLLSIGPKGAKATVELMNSYNLTREDWDSLHDLSQLRGMPDPLKRIDSKTKSAFTRTYNASAHLLPFAQVASSKQKRSPGSASNVLTLEAMENFEDASEVVAVKKENDIDESDDESVTATLFNAKKSSQISSKRTADCNIMNLTLSSRPLQDNGSPPLYRNYTKDGIVGVVSHVLNTMEWEEEGIHFVALEWDNDEPPSYEELFGNPVSSRAEFAGIVQVATLALSVARTTSALQQENIRNPERRRRCYEIETSEEDQNSWFLSEDRPIILSPKKKTHVEAVLLKSLFKRKSKSNGKSE